MFLVLLRFENLKGKFYEIKRAQMNGEQRAYWLYWTEMEYITSQLPNQKPRFAIDANSRNSTAAKPLAATTSQKTNEHSNTTNLSRKTSETTLSNLQLLDSPGNESQIYFQYIYHSLFVNEYSVKKHEINTNQNIDRLIKDIQFGHIHILVDWLLIHRSILFKVYLSLFVCQSIFG